MLTDLYQQDDLMGFFVSIEVDPGLLTGGLTASKGPIQRGQQQGLLTPQEHSRLQQGNVHSNSTTFPCELDARVFIRNWDNRFTSVETGYLALIPIANLLYLSSPPSNRAGTPLGFHTRLFATQTRNSREHFCLDTTTFTPICPQRGVSHTNAPPLTLLKGDPMTGPRVQNIWRHEEKDTLGGLRQHGSHLARHNTTIPKKAERCYQPAGISRR